MSVLHKVSRRQFMAGTGLAAGGLALGVAIPGGHPFAATNNSTDTFGPNVFVRLASDGTVSIIAHRSEMGQGVRTSLPAIVADEMEADWAHVEVVQGDGNAAYGSQNTDGSRSVRRFYLPLRQAGAAARMMLVAAAAKVWQVKPESCRAHLHEVHHDASGRRLQYGELAAVAAQMPVPETDRLVLKPESEFRYIGRSLDLVDGMAMTTGKANYGIDVQLPDMLYASIERPPVLGGTIKTHDASETLKFPGVVAVEVIPSVSGPPLFNPLGGVAVLAKDTWSAQEGRKRLKIEWQAGDNASFDSPAYQKGLLANCQQSGEAVRNRGDVETAFKAAAHDLEACYEAPLLAHASMEPPAATAHYADGRCELWAAVQDPQSTQTTVAQAIGLEPAQVTVHVTLLGGGFGRKSKPDHAVEAALLAKATGKPVKVTWTREDDIRHDYYHAVSAQYLRAGLDRQGRATAWLHRSVFPSIGSTFNAGVDKPSESELALGCVDNPFDLPNIRIERGQANAHVRIGWVRSVSNIHHAFAVCSFADELAAQAKRDPKDYLLQLIGAPRSVDLTEDGAENTNYGESIEQYPFDTGRLRAVIERVAGAAGWGKRMPAAHGLGIAAHRSFLSYVATVVHVSVEQDRLRVHAIDTAVDCGPVINPDRVRSQMEGAAVFGLSLALHGEITAREGAIEQSNFHDYPLARINEVPPTRVHIVETKTALPTGVGEPGVPPLAPALCNAIYAASGRRIRQLPLKRTGLI